MNWVDRHSVNCFICHKIFDEREGGKLEEEGEICFDCQNLPNVEWNEDTGYWKIKEI